MEEKKEIIVKSISKTGLQSWWDNFTDFIKEAFIKTPFETIFEIGLLIAGGSRTIDFMQKMGQSGFIAALALIYAEIGLIFMEFLSYRGKRVQYEYVDRKGKPYKAYPFVNQKSLAKFGLWFVHIPMTVFFTASDIIKTNLETLANNNQIGFADSNFDTGFAWALGVVIALGFLMDLIIIINYKATAPERKHEEEMNQLEHDKLQHRLEMERIEAEEELAYERENGEGLIRAKVKMNKRKGFIDEFKTSLGEEYVESVLEEIDLSVKNKKKTNEKEIESGQESGTGKRAYHKTGEHSKKNKTETQQEKPEPFPVGETPVVDEEKMNRMKDAKIFN